MIKKSTPSTIVKPTIRSVRTPLQKKPASTNKPKIIPKTPVTKKESATTKNKPKITPKTPVTKKESPTTKNKLANTKKETNALKNKVTAKKIAPATKVKKGIPVKKTPLIPLKKVPLYLQKIYNPLHLQKVLNPDKRSEALTNLFSDYYLNCILNSKENVPEIFELENATKLITLIIDHDPLFLEKEETVFNSLLTYFKPIFTELNIAFPHNFYVEFRHVVHLMQFDSLDTSKLSEFTKTIRRLSLQNTP